MVKIPKKLKVGALYYDVVLDDNYQLSLHCGVTKRSALKIVIDGTLAPAIIEETFIHEILHCAFSQAGFIRVSTEKFEISEEELCERLSPILHQILKENKLW